MKATLNYGLNFIKHVDCGREVSKEAHKVLIEKGERFGKEGVGLELRSKEPTVGKRIPS